MTDLEYFINESLQGISVPVTNERILNAVCSHFSVSEKAIKGKTRGKNIVLARHFYMFLLKEKEVFKTLREIGEQTNKDHATALHAIRKLKYWVENYQDIKEIYNKINQKIYNN